MLASFMPFKFSTSDITFVTFFTSKTFSLMSNLPVPRQVSLIRIFLFANFTLKSLSLPNSLGKRLCNHTDHKRRLQPCVLMLHAISNLTFVLYCNHKSDKKGLPTFCVMNWYDRSANLDEKILHRMNISPWISFHDMNLCVV